MFQGANEREIGLLLKLAGVTWARDALELHAPAPRSAIRRRCRTASSPTSGRIARSTASAFELLADATLNDLGARASVAGDARRLQPHPRLPRGRGEGAGGARARRSSSNQIAFHTRRRATTSTSPRRSAPSTRRRAKQLEKRSATRCRAIVLDESGAAGARRHARQEVGGRCRRGGARS